MRNRWRESGFTLLETMLAVAIGAVAILTAVGFLSVSGTKAHELENSSQALTDKNLLRLELQKAVNLSFPVGVWMNQETAAQLGVPWIQGPGAITAPGGSMFITPTAELTSSANLAGVLGATYDVFVFLSNNLKIAPLVLDVSGLVDPGYYISATQTSQTFNVTGPTATYAVGSIVAIEGTIGIQFAKISAVSATTITLDWSLFGDYVVAGQTQSSPGSYFVAGANIYLPSILLLAVTADTQLLTFWSKTLDGSPFKIQSQVAGTVTSLQANDLTGASLPGVTWSLVPHTSTQEIFLRTSVVGGQVQEFLTIEQPF